MSQDAGQGVSLESFARVLWTQIAEDIGKRLDLGDGEANINELMITLSDVGSGFSVCFGSALTSDLRPCSPKLTFTHQLSALPYNGLTVHIAVCLTQGGQ